MKNNCQINPVKLIILDRDGVINKDLGKYVETADEFEFIDGSIDAIVRLKKSGYTVVIATNQAGIEKEIYTHQQLSSIHYKMISSIRAAGGDIDRIVYCPFKSNDHPWRKPNAGMLFEVLKQYKNSIKNKNNIYFIGDTIRDMVAGISANCIPLMVRTGKNEAEKLEQLDSKDHKLQVIAEKVTIFQDLNEVTSFVLQQDII